MATGPEGGIYELIGQRYAEIFARNDVKLLLRRTQVPVSASRLRRAA